MHYRDGSEVKLGDLARSVVKPENVKGYTGIELLGIVVGGTPTAESCNLQLQVVAQREVGPLGTSAWRPSNGTNTCVSTGDCLKVSTDEVLVD